MHIHSLSDRWARQVSYLRVSVTDRCNYRCVYCMPEDGWTPSQRDALLNFEELFKVIQIMVHLGVNRIRFTGGEPLIRKDLIHLIQKVI